MTFVDDTRLEKLLAYEQAEREGRLIILPVKPSGSTIYQLRTKSHALGLGVHPRAVACARVWSPTEWSLCHNGQRHCTAQELGKTWFLTEEEARTALEELRR